MLGIEHFGSTAVPGLIAKPVIDILVGAPAPANADAAVLTRPVPPIAASRSHTRVLGTRPHPQISDHMPERMSPPWRDGIITAPIVRENPDTITNTGKMRSCPSPTGIVGEGNHKSH